MNYIKYELSKYKENEIIFASKLYKEKLYNKVSEASFYKTLERMTKNKEIEKLSKGIYYFPLKSKYGLVPIKDEEIILIFTKNNEGMEVGYSLYNRLNLTTQVSKKRKVYSCNLENDIKNIRNIEIKNYQIEFNKKYKQTIEMFEVLQNFNKIEDLNYKSFYEYAREYTNVYNEKIVDQVIKTMKYKKSTISFLNNILDYFNVDNNLNKYLSSLSKYNHKTMEEIYEFTQTQERF